MRSLMKPDASRIMRFLAEQSTRDFTYQGIGATLTHPPDGYVIDHTRVHLGTGVEIFERAKAAIRRWQQFNLGWVEACPNDVAILNGESVCVLARALGLWWMNACRIVDVIDEPQRRFGFAYGTLPDHVGSGEERFLVEVDEAGEVWYDILAFSRPERWLSRCGYPFMRRVQRRFGIASAAAMRRAVEVPE